MALKITQSGLDLIKRFEGCKLTPYVCPAGVLTVGYGSTGPHVRAGVSITPAEADALFLRDVKRFDDAVVALTGGRSTTPSQHSALVSFAFNLGTGALGKSTLLTLHKAGEFKLAAEQFMKWDKARVGGVLKPLAGLTKRRAAERDLYLS